jgi:hypothetical protein
VQRNGMVAKRLRTPQDRRRRANGARPVVMFGSASARRFPALSGLPASAATCSARAWPGPERAEPAPGCRPALVCILYL